MQLKNCRKKKKKKTQRTKETKEETTNNEQMHWYMVETPQLAQSDSLTSKAFTPLQNSTQALISNLKITSSDLIESL